MTNELLPPVTIIVEWENAVSLGGKWASRAMSAFESELLRCVGRFAARPTVLYLFDPGLTNEAAIRSNINVSAPRLATCANLSIIEAPDLTYYKLKNHGAKIAETDIVVMLDSDAGPEPGWLEALLKPFSQPEVQAVGGFTVLGHDDLLSKTMALSWIFDLPSERERTIKRKKIHANNCAFRTAFLRQHPFPDLEAFKKQCGFWLRRIDSMGYRWVRTADAMTVHAPHPGGQFLIWRAWTTGLDRDFQVNHTVTNIRLGRFLYAFYFWFNKIGRSWFRIWTKGSQVGLKIWQRPVAMVISFGFFSVMLAGETWSSLVRKFSELPIDMRTAQAA